MAPSPVRSPSPSPFDPSRRPSLGVGLVVVLILVGTALAVWFYLRGPVVQAEPRTPQLEHDSRLDGNGLTREDGPGVARRGS
ncbi:MAG: hypothetical protein L6Q99_09395 [Planctomycetes bacterium]|nr:hypothetical protein [Planctomycetota bacterium]